MPLCAEAVAAITLRMLRCGRLYPACATFLSFDGWLRQQDWSGLRAEDAVVQPDGVTGLFFGVRARGEKSKTGPNQGLVLRTLWLRPKGCVGRAPGVCLYLTSRPEP